MRCLNENARESPVMSLDESVAIMEVADQIRSQWTQRAGSHGV